MTEAEFLILTSLLEAPMHGYGIVQAVREMSGERVRLPVGTLYGVLDRLSADGLVALDREEAHRGRLRRYYRVTEGGAQALGAEAARLAGHARLASERLGRTQARPTGAGGTA